MVQLRCLVFCALLTCSGALFLYGARFRDDVSAKTEKVYIRHIDSVHDRSKRDARTMPISLVLALERASGSHCLNLTRSKDLSHINVYKNENGNSEPVHIPRNQDIEIYSDKKGTGLMVERTGRDQYIVAGMYNDGDYIRDIYPTHRHRRNEVNGVVSGSHIIRNVKVDLGGIKDVALEKKVEKRRQEIDALKRGERDVSVALRTIEIMFHSDAADWQNFLTIADGNTANAMADMQIFYALCEECVNFNYNSLPATQICIDIEVKKLEVFMTAGEPAWVYANLVPATTTYNAGAIVGSMAGNPATALAAASARDPGFDHWTLFSGEDLVASDGGGGFLDVAGVAFQGRLCETDSTSVNENNQGVGTFTTLSHELGHSQNLRHDVIAGCNDADGFIMATSFSFPGADMPGNYFSFSSCSITELIAFYTTMGGCTLTTGVAVDEFTPDLMGQLAGQIYDVDEQCDRANADDNLCRGVMEARVPSTYCQLIFCGRTESGSCSGITPMQGTSCGNQQWCINGSCVFDAAAPVRPENCPFGDEPGANCNLNNCEARGILCCETCAPPVTEATTDAVTDATTEAVTDATRDSATDATTDAATDATTDAATDATMDAVTGATTDAVTDATMDAVTDATRDSASDATTDAATDATMDAITGPTTDAATGATMDAATDATTDAVTGATMDAVTGATTDAVTGPTMDAATDATTDAVTGATMDAVTGATTDATTASSGLQPGTVLSTTVFIIESC